MQNKDMLVCSVKKIDENNLEWCLGISKYLKNDINYYD